MSTKTSKIQKINEVSSFLYRVDFVTYNSIVEYYLIDRKNPNIYIYIYIVSLKLTF